MLEFMAEKLARKLTPRLAWSESADHGQVHQFQVRVRIGDREFIIRQPKRAYIVTEVGLPPTGVGFARVLETNDFFELDEFLINSKK